MAKVPRKKLFMYTSKQKGRSRIVRLTDETWARLEKYAQPGDRSKGVRVDRLIDIANQVEDIRAESE